MGAKLRYVADQTCLHAKPYYHHLPTQSTISNSQISEETQSSQISPKTPDGTVVACISDVAAVLCIRKPPNRMGSFPTRQHGVRCAHHQHRCALACRLRRWETRVLPAPRPASAGVWRQRDQPPLAAVPFARRAEFTLPASGSLSPKSVAIPSLRRETRLAN